MSRRTLCLGSHDAGWAEMSPDVDDWCGASEAKRRFIADVLVTHGFSWIQGMRCGVVKLGTCEVWVAMISDTDNDPELGPPTAYVSVPERSA